MSSLKSMKILPRPSEAPAKPPATAIEGAPAPTPAALPVYPGDRFAFALWVVCAVLLAALLFADLVLALFRL